MASTEQSVHSINLKPSITLWNMQDAFVNALYYKIVDSHIIQIRLIAIL